MDIFSASLAISCTSRKDIILNYWESSYFPMKISWKSREPTWIPQLLKRESKLKARSHLKSVSYETMNQWIRLIPGTNLGLTNSMKTSIVICLKLILWDFWSGRILIVSWALNSLQYRLYLNRSLKSSSPLLLNLKLILNLSPCTQLQTIY